jgi:hypothetical protein
MLVLAGIVPQLAALRVILVGILGLGLATLATRIMADVVAATRD